MCNSEAKKRGMCVTGTQRVKPGDLDCSFGYAEKNHKETGWSRRSLCYSHYRSTDGRRSVNQDHISWSLRLVLRSPRQKGHRTVKYITSVCTCKEEKVEKQSHRTRSSSQREIRRELPSISKAIHIPSGRGPLSSLPSWGLEEPCPKPQRNKEVNRSFKN